MRHMFPRDALSADHTTKCTYAHAFDIRQNASRIMLIMIEQDELRQRDAAAAIDVAESPATLLPCALAAYGKLPFSPRYTGAGDTFRWR